MAAVIAVLLGVLLVVLVLAVRGLLVVASIGPRAGYWDERAAQPGDVVQVALGDSLSQGIGSSGPDTSFVGVLADDLAARTGQDVRVVNLSVTGAETGELVADQLPRFEDLLTALAEDGTPLALVTLCIGANDVGNTSPGQFRADLVTVLDALPPGSLVSDLPDFGGGPERAMAMELSAVVREEVAARPDLVLVDLEDATTGQGLEEYAADFFHPSDVGYQRYVAAFRDAVAASDPEPVVLEPADGGSTDGGSTDGVPADEEPAP